MVLIPWEFEDNGYRFERLDDFAKGAVGFIYEIEFNNGKKYLGRKALYHKRTMRPLKGKKRKRVKMVESNWKDYLGSFKNQGLKEKIKTGEIYPVRRAIITVCYDAWQMTYFETKYLFVRDCLLDDNYYNNNILGKFYKPERK